MDELTCLPELHLFKKNGKNLLLDVQTCRVFRVDELAFQILGASNLKKREEVLSALRNSYPAEDIEVAYTELKESRLIAEKPFEFEDPTFEYSEYEIRNMDLILSQDCNMRCVYCFADQGAFRGKRGFMRPEVGRKTIDFLIEKSGKSKRVGVVFFGGEPLLNMVGLKALVLYGNEKAKAADKEVRYSVSTNGTLLNEELIEYFNRERINIQISIDGDADTQNVNRPLKNKRPSYPTVEGKSILFLGKTKQDQTSARTTITSNSVERAFDNILHILAMGFYSVHTETAEGTTGRGFLSSEDYRALENRIDLIADELMRKISRNEFFGYSNIIKFLKHLNANGKNFYSCAAGRGYVAVGANGDIFPCHRFVNSTYRMGNVMAGTFDRRWEKEIHVNTNVFSRVPCNSCWARFLCGGDCIAVSEDYYKDVTTPNPMRCELIKHVIETAIMVYSSIAKSSKPEIENLYHFYKRGRKEIPTERQI